jgi:hypothetical protein
MTRAVSHFRQADLARAVRALKAAHIKIERIDIAADGKLSVIVGQNGKQEEGNPWDEVLSDGDDSTPVR